MAAFSRAALELMSLGAPPELIAGCHRAALEEIEHAQMCFALAAHYGATNVAPGGLTGAAPRATDRVRLAVDTFLEGCVGETIAALSLHRAATRCADPGVTAILTRMANEEADHAALAWSTVRWAATGRTDVLEAVQSAASTLELPTPTPAPADDLSAWGRLSDADEARAAQDALRDLVHPMLAQVSDS